MRAAKNPWIGINYLDLKPGVAPPPAFWLQRLYDYDADLVLFPSTAVPFGYVLARKARISGYYTDQSIVETVTHPDTRYCLTHKLVPVTMITQIGSIWDADSIIRALMARDIWRVGGADKAADMVEGADAAREAKIKADIRADMWNRSGDAWRSYQARTGQRVTVGPTRNGAASNTAPSGSTAGSGHVTLT